MFQAKDVADAGSGGEKVCFPSKNDKYFSATVVQSAWKDATSGEWLERGELPGRKVSDYAVW